MQWTTIRYAVFAGLMAITVILPGSCVSPWATDEQQVTPKYTESTARFRKIYLLAPGDQVDVIVRGNPDVSRLCLVRPDGHITLPLLGDVKAAGLTIPRLDEELAGRLSERLVDPEVTVVAIKVREPMVYVLGEVVQPQPVPHRLATTAAQAVAYAGGLRRSGVGDAVALIRLTDEGRLRAYKIPVRPKGQPAPYMALQATVLQPDDIILVPESGISQFDRWVNDYITQPLQGVNAILAPVTNYLLIMELRDSSE